MADFQELQRRITEKRRAQEGAQRALLRTTDQIAQVDAKLAGLSRGSREDDRQERVALEAKRRALLEARQERESVLGRARGELGDIYPTFWETWTDPRTNAGQMRDDTPVMLFPVRLETRFKSVAGPRGTQIQQLWVRVYPDECLIDTFEETLSQTQLDSAGIFWREYFHAAGVEASERAAWRGLVASHGSGRATWIIKQYRPRNPLKPGDPEGEAALEVKPQSLAGGEVILVVSSDSVLPNAEATALAKYWGAAWKAAGDAALEGAAQTALTGAVGAARAAELVKGFRPYSLTETPPATFTRETATVRVAFLVLPKREDVDAQSRSWMKAASAGVLPERFVLLGYQGGTEVLNQISEPVQGPFAVSPDPAASAESQFQFDENGTLTLGEDLRWMTDFDEAVRRGMAFRVNLTAETARGFDRLLVLGLRLSSDATQSKTELETLLQHHYFSRAGFSFLPQGSATNNTEEGSSAYSREDDADASYAFVFKGKAQFTETDEWLDKSDGQWFAESLGLDTEWLKQVPHAGAADQIEARAMNTALWPATLGYFMDTLLQPVFNDDEIYYTRWFFSRFVSGRGMIPAIRIGRQPYGILPASAFSRARWVFGQETFSYTGYASRYQEQRGTAFKDWLWKFKGVLDRLHERWRNLSLEVSHVDVNTTDPHQTLLDIVGLHPASVEFHQRYANTKQQEHNLAAIWNMYIRWQTLPANELHNEAYSILADLGYTEPQVPLLFDLFWKVGANRLDGPVIQEGALSEVDPLRVVTTNNRNYIEWLREWARLSFDAIRVQDGFQANQWPNALLYILLKHALELGYHDAGVRILDEAALLDAQAKLDLRKEPHFFHVAGVAEAAGAAPSATATRSRYEMLYSPSERVTGDSRTLLVDHITRNIGALSGTRFLTEQLRSLEKLERTPTARLERLLAEHLDCCTYRLDAWMNGLLNFQLASMRYPQGENEERTAPRKGIYLGAYGWLENVRPENKTLTPVQLSEELDEVFNKQQPAGQNAPLMRDDKNEGYIHTPSINHAVTAAVLRNGYIANATPTEPDLLKVNLSSERVRLALGVIEGIRNGQSLAALLGYRFERGLHDRHTFAECDQFIYPLRLLFPLYTRPEDVPDGVPIESIEARNVVNGLNLVRHVKNAAEADRSYPFGFPTTKLPAATTAQRDAINAEVDRLLDMHDALADLAMAEGVHQVVMGNYDRAAATMDAYSQATFPPVPEVVQTPRSGIALTHRVGVHFDSAVPIAAADSPRVKAEPAVNRWVAGILPDATRVGCTVHYLDPLGAEQTTVVTQDDLGLQPLDLLYVMNPDNLQPRSELEDRIRDVVLRQAALAVRPDLLKKVSYGKGAAHAFSFMEVAPIVRSLRALLLHSRSLRASDVALPTEASGENASVVTLMRTRVDFLEAELEAFKGGPLMALRTELEGVLPEAGPVTATILTDIDDYLDAVVAACRGLARYGVPQTGFGVFHEGRAGIFTILLKKAADVALRWQRRLDDYDALMLTLPPLVDEAERIALLLQAEQQISTAATDTEGLTSAQVLVIVQAKEAAFRTRQQAFAKFHQTSETTVSSVLAAFTALLPITDFDSQETNTVAEEQQIVVLAENILARTQQLIADLEQRIGALHAKLEEQDAVAAPEKRVQLVTDAARTVLGDEFVLVPQFTVPERQAAEWANAYDNRELLLNHQKITLKNAFPVDDWLYGSARVREKLHHVENLTFLTEALGTTAPELRAVQFPFAADAPWMALEYPPESKGKLERELLLYTAHYSSDFDGTKAQCGLLLDEWTEVIPADTETTGLTFHFDKPSTEPPQTILVATPTQFTGQWTWSDLVATLHETLDLARTRAVEPKQLDKDPLSVFLPATILATTWQPITIAADLSLVNKYASRMP
jgi:hypothetical protein